MCGLRQFPRGPAFKGAGGAHQRHLNSGQCVRILKASSCRPPYPFGLCAVQVEKAADLPVCGCCHQALRTTAPCDGGDVSLVEVAAVLSGRGAEPATERPIHGLGRAEPAGVGHLFDGGVGCSPGDDRLLRGVDPSHLDTAESTSVDRDANCRAVGRTTSTGQARALRWQ